MTREELRDYVDEQRTLNNIPYHVYSTLIDGIDTLEQETCEVAVSLQEAIDIVRHECGEWKGLAKEIVKQFNGLPPVTPQPKTGHWIPVNERLPKEKGLYLVSVKNDHERRYSKTCWFHGDGNWFARQDVEAWMPLPKSYEPQESEET